MRTTTTYDSTKESLHDLLRNIDEGKIQLPDFQRGWIWDDEHIRSLLASLSLSYPIGAVMLLETGNPQVRFRPRPVEGVQIGRDVEPERLILDGQQRLTSLYQALFVETPVNTRDPRKKPVARHYYIDIAKAVEANGDREEAIISLPEDRIVRNFRGEILQDFSTPEKEYEVGTFPLYRIFNYDDWFMGFQEYWDYDKEKLRLFNAFNREIIKRFEQYLMPVILLKKPTPKVAVCQVFEKVNTGGVSLTVFELLTATFAADDFNLRDDWKARERELHRIPVLRDVDSTSFLQAVTLLTSWSRKQATPEAAVTCKRQDVLALTLDDYKAHADAITAGLKRAAKLLHTQRIYSSRDLPYNTQLIPLSAILAALKDRDNDTIRNKIVRWYWCGVFGELYGGAIESRFARDLTDVLDWIDGGTEPATITDANFAQSRLRSLRSRNSAAYKGLSILLLKDGGLDFRTGEPIDVRMYFDESIDIHHIFPRNWCKDRTNEQLGLDILNVGRSVIDSIINKTLLSARTNRMIGANPPSVYVERIQKRFDIQPDRLDALLASHLIDAKALRSDDFVAFFRARERALLDRIEHAMGKAVLRDLITDSEPDEIEEEELEEQIDPVTSIAETEENDESNS